MPFLEKRRLVRVGKSRGVVLSKSWLDYYGDVRNLVLLGNDVLVIAPEGYESEARRLLERFRREKRKNVAISQG